MNFKPRELTITDSMEVLSIIDTFVYMDNEYALAAPISDKTHTIHRICKWDEKENWLKSLRFSCALLQNSINETLVYCLNLQKTNQK